MTPGKWFGKSKAKKEETIDIEESVPVTVSRQEPTISSRPQEIPAESPVLEYRETLYSRDLEKKPTLLKPYKEPLKRSSWENPSTIERNVDAIRKKSVYENQEPGQGIEEKVDKALKKKKP